MRSKTVRKRTRNPRSTGFQDYPNDTASTKTMFFFRAVWKFGQTRFVIALTLMALSMFFQFAGPSLVLKAILDYIKVR